MIMMSSTSKHSMIQTGLWNQTFGMATLGILSQISYSLVVILELSGVLEVQYKKIMMSSINKDN